MTKVTLSPVSNPQNLTSLAATINANSDVITAAFDNTISRDGDAPNQMQASLDMNSNQIINLPAPSTQNSPARLIDVVSNPTIVVPGTGTSGHTVPFLDGNNTWSGTNLFSSTSTFNGSASFTGGATFSSITLPATSVTTANLQNNSVDNTKLAQMASNTIKGNNTGGTANAADLTTAQVSAMLNVTSNSSSTISANYTVQDSDAGTTILLGGGSFFTVTFNAPGTYANSRMSVRLINANTRAIRVSPSGVVSFLLWPGQITTVYSQGSWVYDDPGRYRKAGLNFYVDTVNGNDNNDGLGPTTGAFKTINAAVNALYSQIDCNNGSPTINIAAGTYTESITLQGQLTGYNFVLFQGAGSTVVTWKPAIGYCVVIGDNAEAIFSGIKFDNTAGPAGNIAVSMHQPSVVDFFSDINFGAFVGGFHINNDKGGYVNFGASYTISGGCASHIQMVNGTVFVAGGITVTITGAPVIGTMYVGLLGAMINFAGAVTYSGAPAAGTQKYSLDYLSCMLSAASTIPGTVAGALGHNSIFV